MTLPRTPDDVKVAMNRVDQPLYYYDRPGIEGPVEIVQVEDQAGNKRDQIRWYWDPENPTVMGVFYRDQYFPDGVGPQLQAIANERFEDVELVNKWTRGSTRSPYTQDPILKVVQTQGYHFSSPNSSSGITKIQGRGLRGGGGATIATGGLGVYPTAETTKRKLGA
jgi:hypothetical protein